MNRGRLKYLLACEFKAVFSWRLLPVLDSFLIHFRIEKYLGGSKMKSRLFAAAAVAAMIFAGCSSNEDTTKESASAGDKTETAYVTTDDGGEVSASVTKDAEGKVTGVAIDQTQEDGSSKKELKEEYGMKDASPIKKEWYEQIEFLENYIIENGVDSVKLNDEGYAENEDVKSGCTIYLGDIMKAVDEANAK